VSGYRLAVCAETVLLDVPFERRIGRAIGDRAA